MAEIRAITVKQPWAFAIVHGGKTIENRSRGTSYRGTLAIHAGAAWSERGANDPYVLNAWTAWLAGRDASVQTPEHQRDWWERLDTLDPDDEREQLLMPRGAIIAVADLVDSHLDDGCCRPWGMSEYDEGGGRIRTGIHHLVLDGVRELAAPVPCRGALGLWRVPDDLGDLASTGAGSNPPGGES